jgi:hypothetical protein
MIVDADADANVNVNADVDADASASANAVRFVMGKGLWCTLLAYQYGLKGPNLVIKCY